MNDEPEPMSREEAHERRAESIREAQIDTDTFPTTGGAAMIDTPRTDAEAGYYDGSGCWKSTPSGECVPSDFARTLETELTSATTTIADLTKERDETIESDKRARAAQYGSNKVCDMVRRERDAALVNLESAKTLIDDMLSTFRDDDKTTIITSDRQEMWVSERGKLDRAFLDQPKGEQG